MYFSGLRSSYPVVHRPLPKFFFLEQASFTLGRLYASETTLPGASSGALITEIKFRCTLKKSAGFPIAFLSVYSIVSERLVKLTVKECPQDFFC
jgi:hypothetical protein